MLVLVFAKFCLLSLSLTRERVGCAPRFFDYSNGITRSLSSESIAVAGGDRYIYIYIYFCHISATKSPSMNNIPVQDRDCTLENRRAPRRSRAFERKGYNRTLLGALVSGVLYNNIIKLHLSPVHGAGIKRNMHPDATGVPRGPRRSS